MINYIAYFKSFLLMQETFFEKRDIMSKKDKAIIVVSFGTSFIEVLDKTIGVCEKEISEAFPDYEIRRAFTSNMIRKSLLKKENMNVDNLEQALDKLISEGYKEVFIQPLHIIPGEEYHEKIIKPSLSYFKKFETIKIGKSLLFDTADYFKLIEALKNQLPGKKEGQAVIFMGHGASHPANACYAALQLKLIDEIPDTFIANVEGYPELEDIEEKIKGYKTLLLMPLMLVAGDHAMNDMAGDDEDSWKSVLESKEYEVEIYMKGLGENIEIRKIYIESLTQLINSDS